MKICKVEKCSDCISFGTWYKLPEGRIIDNDYCYKLAKEVSCDEIDKDCPLEDYNK